MMSSPQILIVEDDKDVAELYRYAMRSSGLEAEIIRVGEDALARLAVTVPNIVLLDLKLSPHLSGSDILRSIRSDPRLAKTRVIVVTGHPALAETMKDEVDLILIKPVEISELINYVTRFLSAGTGN